MPRARDRIPAAAPDAEANAGSEAERSAAQVRRAAGREGGHGSGPGKRRQRQAADSESAAASHVLTRRGLAKGHPRSD
ncbi:MAG: hypothetical protein ACM3JG_16200 [Thiohalocapsa sp.]